VIIGLWDGTGVNVCLALHVTSLKLWEELRDYRCWNAYTGSDSLPGVDLSFTGCGS